MNRLSASIIIPSWNSSQQLLINLPHVFRAATKIDAEVIVVDDASQDDSIAIVKDQKYPIRLYTHSVNKGFAATVNEGVSHAKGDVVILLNTDVRPEPDCFVNALRNFDDPKICAVTFNSDSGWARAQWDHGLFHHLRATESTQASHHESIFASGGQAAFDKSKWELLGGMDTLYEPFYWEDVDLGYRAWKRGWKIVWDKESKCTHDHKQSVIRSGFTPKYVKQIAQRNQLLFHWKNIHDPSLMLNHLIHLPRYIKNYPEAFFAALKMLPRVLRARAITKKHSTVSDGKILAMWK